MIPDDRRDELLDIVLRYNKLLRAETKDITNEERVFFLEALRTAIKAAEDVFRTAVEQGHGNEK
jgi:hypothetical protein